MFCFIIWRKYEKRIDRFFDICLPELLFRMHYDKESFALAAVNYLKS